MIKDWLNSYSPQNKAEALHYLREIMQEVALAGLYRAGFFEKAAFYGWTALRIFHGLNRFFENLDFSLLKTNPLFSLENYLDSIQTEFKSSGMAVSIRERQQNNTPIDSAFLKSETIWKELVLEDILGQKILYEKATLKIKLEVDTQPLLGFETEEKLLLRPFSFYVKCYSLKDLFAGKMHALLFRKWKENVKGRDWYDLEWYIKRGTALNLHFLLRAKDSRDWKEEIITENQLRDLLKKRINTVNFDRIKADISRFIANPKDFGIWSPGYFHDLMAYLKIDSQK